MRIYYAANFPSLRTTRMLEANPVGSDRARAETFVRLVGYATLAAINRPLLTPFCASEHYLSSTLRVPLAATASLSRFLICR